MKTYTPTSIQKLFKDFIDKSLSEFLPTHDFVGNKEDVDAFIFKLKLDSAPIPEMNEPYGESLFTPND